MGRMLDYLWSLLPPVLAKPRGKRVTKAFGDLGDQFRDECAFGVREAMAEEATADALPAHLRNRNLQVIDGEIPATSLFALRTRWDQWRESGGYDGIPRALARLGYPAQCISTLDLQLLGAVDPFANRTNFFFVLISQPHRIGSGNKWNGGKKWKADGALWGISGITRSQIEDIFLAIRRFKPATHTCRFVLIEIATGVSRVIPMWEPWEQLGDGSYPEYYNLSALVP